jgi:leucyl aminopeptidase
VVAVFEDADLSPSAQLIDEAGSKLISALFKRGDIDGTLGKVLMIPHTTNMPADRLLLVGCGKAEDYGSKALQLVASAAIRRLSTSKIDNTGLFLAEMEIDGTSIADRTRLIATTIVSSLYKFDQLKTDADTNTNKLKNINIYVPQRGDMKDARVGMDDGLAIGHGMNLARDLGNLPGNICTPTYMATQAKDIAKKHGQRVKILDEDEMANLGMGSLLSVSRGSRQPAKLIVIEHKGGKKKDAPVVLVGKGLTFDAGGISIKPAAAMDEMKFDMCGGASVLGTMQAIGEMKLPLNVIGIVPSSENMPDGDANKPGDVVTSMSGQTIEILNTDAEGRLILCDALTYAEKFKPAAVIDIATLTGACVIALGAHASGLFSNNDELADEIIAAGEDSRDRVWRLPLWAEYDEQLKSNFADMANIGGRGAGAVTAASFLARYTKKYDWAHLDIAGTAWLSGGDKGSTGRPVGLLCQFLRTRAGE